MLRALALAALAAAPLQEEDLYANSYKGKAPPELVSEKAHWINATEPLKLGDLKGRKVVWLEFGFLK